MDEINSQIAALRRAIRALPDECREMLVLQLIKGFSVGKIAAQLHLPEAVVRKSLAQVRMHLAEVLARANNSP